MAAFAKSHIVDAAVSSYEIDLRLAAMRRALVAHLALSKVLSQVGVTDLPTSLIGSSKKAEEMCIVGDREGRMLRFFNKEANESKHGGVLPF